MSFIRKYWYLVFITVITISLGVVTFLTSQKLKNAAPVAPTVPQAQPQAVTLACTKTLTIVFPSPTATPTATPTNTPTATPTPTSAPNTLPECTGLSVVPSSGNPPLSVTLTCSGIDRDGDITAAEFTFGDGNTKTVEKNVGSPGSLSTTYSYGSEGSFGASCRVRDNNVAWASSDACKKSVTVESKTQTYRPPGTRTYVPINTPTPTLAPGETPPPTPTPQPTPKVPVAGSGPGVLGATTIAGGFLFLFLGFLF